MRMTTGYFIERCVENKRCWFIYLSRVKVTVLNEYSIVSRWNEWLNEYSIVSRIIADKEKKNRIVAVSNTHTK